MVVMSLFSCTTELNDPVANSSFDNVLESKFNAVELEDNNAMYSNLPELSMKEAETILSALKNHTNDKEDLEVKTASQNDMHKWQVVMKHTIDNKYTFTIQLNLTSYDDGSLFYNGYSNNCSLDEMKWQVGGFSFASDNASEKFKFQSQSYLYIKVFDQDETKFYQIPVAINGLYNPMNHEASYDYSI